MFITAILFGIVIQMVQGLNNGLGLVPFMGWRPYDHEGCVTNQKFIKDIVDAFIKAKLNEMGYSYIFIDKCWQAGRDESTSRLLQDKEKYPNGIKALADYTHQKGLKLGITGGASYQTCNNQPGIKNYEQIDTLTYAEWGIDAVAFDYCSNETQLQYIKQSFFKIQKTFNESGRRILIMMDYWGNNGELSSNWAGPFVNSWRVFKNLENKWKSVTNMVDKSLNLSYYAGPGGYNDLGTLLFGSKKLKLQEQISQFYLWVMLKSPLFLGFRDKISPEVLKVLRNPQVMKIYKDSIGMQATRIQKAAGGPSPHEAYSVNLTNNRYAILFINKGQTKIQAQVSIKDQMKLKYKKYTIRDIMKHEDLGTFEDDILAEELQPHQATIYIIRLVEEKSRQKKQINTDL